MNTRIFLFSIIFISIIASTAAQNIISNGSFEERSDYQCNENPFTAFNTIYDWTDYFTAHLWTDGCPLDTSVWWFYNPAATAYEGFNSVGIGGDLSKEGVMNSVYMASKLKQTLNIGQEHYFQLQVRNVGIWHANPDSLRICDTDDPKQIQITFGNENSLAPENFSLDTPFDLSFTSSKLQSSESSDWERFSDCFIANQNHSHIALSLTRSAVEMSAPCVYRENAGISYFFYEFDVDELLLYPLPEQIDTTFNACQQIEVEINLEQLAKVPNGVPIRFLWEDGFEGAKRTLTTFETYDIEAILDCTSFPIQIHLVKEDCKPKIYVPNAFSPNEDGNNDELTVFIDTEFEIQNYVFSIFGRWGNLIFQTNNPTQAWNAKVNNRLVGRGLYIWSLRFDISLNNGEHQSIQESGSVSVVY